jgi:hypothetical protein
MTQQFHSAFTILRRKQVQAESGYSRSTIYLRVARWKHVRLGPRAVAGPLAKCRPSTLRASPANPTMKYALWWRGFAQRAHQRTTPLLSLPCLFALHEQRQGCR